MKKQTLISVGVISLVLAAICFYAATRYIDSLAVEKLFAPVVKVVEGKVIDAFVPITREDVVLVLEETDEIMKDSFQTVESILGKQTIQPLFAGEQVIKPKLTDGYLLPEQGKARYEFSISSMMPVTEVRKGDFVKVWVRYKAQSELESMPNPIHFQKSDLSAELLFQTQLVTVKDNSGIEIYTLKPSILPGPEELDDPLFNGSKAKNYVDSERRFRDYRAQPSSVPSYIGFNLTDQQYKTLTEAMSYGTVQIGHVLALKEGKIH